MVNKYGINIESVHELWRKLKVPLLSAYPKGHFKPESKKDMSEWCLPYEDGSNWLLDETDDEKEQSEDEEDEFEEFTVKTMANSFSKPESSINRFCRAVACPGIQQTRQNDQSLPFVQYRPTIFTRMTNLLPRILFIRRLGIRRLL